MSVMANPYARYLSLAGDVLPARAVATFAPMTFLENLDVGVDGSVVMSSLLDGRIWRVPFGGEPYPVTQVAGRPSGIVAAPHGGWLAFGWTDRGKVAVFDIQSDGRWEVLAEAPHAIFPNGGQRMPNAHYLFADSIAATIWDVDYFARSVSPWYRHDSFAPRPGAWAPALNGIRLWGDKLYMSNSSTCQFLAMPVRDGKPAGQPTVVKADIDIDDFAFDCHGTAYLTTHPHDVVLKLTQDGALSRVAGPAEGVRGCTACCFGRAAGDETGLYVCADGGLFNPLSGGLQPAKLVRLETGIAGAPVHGEP